MKASLVEKNTGIVVNVIMVDSLDDPVGEDYMLAPMQYIEHPVDPEYVALVQILKEIDPDYIEPEKIRTEVTINIGVTKWDEVNQRYYE